MRREIRKPASQKSSPRVAPGRGVRRRAATKTSAGPLPVPKVSFAPIGVGDRVREDRYVDLPSAARGDRNYSPYRPESLAPRLGPPYHPRCGALDSPPHRFGPLGDTRLSSVELWRPRTRSLRLPVLFRPLPGWRLAAPPGRAEDSSAPGVRAPSRPACRSHLRRCIPRSLSGPDAAPVPVVARQP